MNSPIVGSFPAQVTAIMDPPTWFMAIPATMTVDGACRSSASPSSASGRPTRKSTSAPGSAVIAHGTSISGSDRSAIFAMNPLYRADPERESTRLGSAAYWADR